MKPLHVSIEYFTSQIVRRASKSFADSSISKQDFDEILNSVEKIKTITSKVEKEGNGDAKDKCNKESNRR